MISRSTKWVLRAADWLQHSSSHPPLSSHKHNKIKSEKEATKGTHEFKTYPVLTGIAPMLAATEGWKPL